MQSTKATSRNWSPRIQPYQSLPHNTTEMTPARFLSHKVIPTLPALPPLVILNMNWLARTKPDETLLLKCMLPHRVILRRRFRRLAHPSFVQSVPTNKSRCGKNNLHFNDSHLSVTNQKMSPVPAERTHSNITRSVSVFRPF